MYKKMNVSQKFVRTKKLKIAYYHFGEGNEKQLLLLHGNLSSSAFFLPLVPMLETKYELFIPDLRCFGNSDALPIDATRGYRDFSDDVYDFVTALGLTRFNICGWSMGGNIAMQLLTDHEELIEKMILLAPGSPYGFGGTKDEIGTPCSPVGLGSGGGCANPALVSAAATGNPVILKDILDKFYFTPLFTMPKFWEDLFIEELKKIKIGNDKYPGNYTFSVKWPYVVAGTKGILNAMSSKYGRLDNMLDVYHKPDVLWIHGRDDIIVSDTSLIEFGYLGKAGFVPGWPGERLYPPQPMVSQIRYFLEMYRTKGGEFAEALLPGGHMCALEHPELFISAVDTFL